jgi:hypothetical protein
LWTGVPKLRRQLSRDPHDQLPVLTLQLDHLPAAETKRALVARLMAAAGLVDVSHRKFVTTTDRGASPGN